jgi:peptidoglycan/LPS O-acetylase OafA/YrhL
MTKGASHEHNAKPIYRPDIDGIRAVAILSVVIFHAFPSYLAGGFVGVDIFFVISGFLISSIIFRSLERDDFSYLEFYAHRVRRIFPGLVVVLVATYAFGWFALLPEEFKQLGKHVAAGAAFIQNFALWREAGYFDNSSELKPLMHLWSLAIEEQFYLVYPVLVWIVWRARVNALLAVVVLWAASFYLNVTSVEADPTGTFFLPQTRFWELLSGSILAYVHLRRWDAAVLGKLPLAKHVLSLIGAALIGAALYFIDAGSLFPGWWAVLPVAGAFLLILAGPMAVLNRFVLANPIMVFIGLISYPLYLWHWPIFSYLRIVEGDLPDDFLVTTAVGASFVLAWLTYRLFERPIRFGAMPNLKAVALAMLVLFSGLSGAYTFENDGFPGRINQAMTEKQLLAERGRYWGASNTAGAPFSASKTNVIIFGDSQAHDILHALKNDKTIGLKFFEADHYCSSFYAADVGLEALHGATCKASFERLLASDELKQADVIIYAHMWRSRQGAELQDAYANGIRQIRERNKDARIYFFGPKYYLSPVGSINIITRGVPNLWAMNEFIAGRVFFDADNDYVKRLAAANHVGFVDVRDVFCQGGCVYYGAGKFSYFDSHHWTQAGATSFYEKLNKTEAYAVLRDTKGGTYSAPGRSEKNPG